MDACCHYDSTTGHSVPLWHLPLASSVLDMFFLHSFHVILTKLICKLTYQRSLCQFPMPSVQGVVVWGGRVLITQTNMSGAR